MVHQNTHHHPLFTNLPPSLPVWMSHGDQDSRAAPRLPEPRVYGEQPGGGDGQRGRAWWGCSSIPEVAHTQQGKELSRIFLYNVCGCSGDWTPEISSRRAWLRSPHRWGDGRVICALSGGVDSAVVATLIHRAVGDQLTCIFVDNAFYGGRSRNASTTFSSEPQDEPALRARPRAVPGRAPPAWFEPEKSAK